MVKGVNDSMSYSTLGSDQTTAKIFRAFTGDRDLEVKQGVWTFLAWRFLINTTSVTVESKDGPLAIYPLRSNAIASNRKLMVLQNTSSASDHDLIAPVCVGSFRVDQVCYFQTTA